MQAASRVGCAALIMSTWLLVPPEVARALTAEKDVVKPAENGVASRKGRIRTENPGAILRERAAGADSLIVEAVSIDKKSHVLLKIEKGAEVAELLRLIDTPEVEIEG